jgi:transcriptional regulator with XRE-family HTH domain
MIGDRLRVLRGEKNYSQGEIKKRAGLLRCYISAWKTVTQYRPSKRLRSLPARSNPDVPAFLRE